MSNIDCFLLNETLPKTASFVCFTAWTLPSSLSLYLLYKKQKGCTTQPFSGARQALMLGPSHDLPSTSGILQAARGKIGDCWRQADKQYPRQV